MAKVDDRRSELKAELIRLATRQIAESGMATLRARDLAKEAGCAVGAIYNVFSDMTALIMAVNGQTFTRIGVAVAAAVTGQDARPEQRLILLARAYVAFADQNNNLWRALFDLDLPDDETVPDWYRAELAKLFSHIAQPVAQLFPDLSPQAQELMVRGLFSSIHGITILGLQRRISGVPRDQVEAMIEQIILRICAKAP